MNEFVARTFTRVCSYFCVSTNFEQTSILKIFQYCAMFCRLCTSIVSTACVFPPSFGFVHIKSMSQAIKKQVTSKKKLLTYLTSLTECSILLLETHNVCVVGQKQVRVAALMTYFFVYLFFIFAVLIFTLLSIQYSCRLFKWQILKL